MTRLIASTLVLAGTAWVAAGSRPSGEAVRQVAAPLQAAWNQHDMKALASLFATEADFASVAVAQVYWDVPGDIGPEGTARPQRSSRMRLAGTPPIAPWLVASAQNSNLLANPPPR